MLTKQQRNLLLFINDYTQETGCSPSFEEMRVGLKLKSKSGIHRLINSLVERGFLARLPNRARALDVVKIPDSNVPQPTSAPRPEARNVRTLRQPAQPASRQLGDEIAEVPLYGKIAAGTPIEAVRQEQATVSIPMGMLGSQPCYALTIEGDSMVKAGIMDGDIVIIEKCDRANDGDIIVALVDEAEVTLKRLRREIGSVVLMPENDSYQPIRLKPERVQIQGKLRSLFRTY